MRHPLAPANLNKQPLTQRLRDRLQPLFKVAIVFTLVASLVFGFAHDANAVPSRSGGRMGGGSFRSAPSRSYSTPRSGGYNGGYRGGYGGYGGGGGFFFFPSPWMFIGSGGGSFLMLLVLIAVGGYLIQTFQRASESGNGPIGQMTQPDVSVVKLQVGLLADARSLQQELNQIALKANTDSKAGLTKVLQETTLSLLRHPEYWVYGATQERQAKLAAAESEFNRYVLAERSKVSGETLSNVAGELKQATGNAITVAPKGELTTQETAEYIVVTLVVGCQGKLDLPDVDDSGDVKRALNQLGAVPSDRLLAVEVMWTPQAQGDVLTRDEMVADYPNLKLV